MVYSPSLLEWWSTWTCSSCWCRQVWRVFIWKLETAFRLPWQQETDETRTQALSQYGSPLDPCSSDRGPACSSSPVKRKNTEGGGGESRLPNRVDNERTRGQTGLAAGPAAQRPTGWEREAGWGVGGVSPATENWHLRLPSERNRAAPYSRSSSSYNSLYLLLLNLKEKMGFWNKKMPIFCTDTWEKKERGTEYCRCVTWGQKRKRNWWRWKGRKQKMWQQRWRAEDLLRVFPPWVEGTAGPDLAVCRLAGSIVTLSRRGRAAKRLKRTGRLGKKRHEVQGEAGRAKASRVDQEDRDGTGEGWRRKT